MQFTAKEIAKKLKGTVEGNENALIWKPCRIEEVDEGARLGGRASGGCHFDKG